MTSYQYTFKGYCIETARKTLVKIACLPEVKSIFHVKPQRLHRTKTRKTFSPNGDGEDEVLEGSYEVTCGNFEFTLYDNYLQRTQFFAVDMKKEDWILIKEKPFLEIGPGTFRWDGRDSNGNYVLPDGDWSLKVYSQSIVMKDKNYVYTWHSANIEDSGFSVTGSTVPAPPTVSTHNIPYEPGVGDTFEVAVNISFAQQLKTIDIALGMPGAAGAVSYMGYEKGEFMSRNDPLASYKVDYDADKEVVRIEIQRTLDGISGDGCLVRLKFLAKESNFMDFAFSFLALTKLGGDGKETKAKAFFENGEIAILSKSYSPSDFNRDGAVDSEDMAAIISCLGSKDGDPSYK